MKLRTLRMDDEMWERIPEPKSQYIREVIEKNLETNEINPDLSNCSCDKNMLLCKEHGKEYRKRLENDIKNSKYYDGR